MNSDQEILFSIVMPTYNRAQMISKSIESVISQSYNNWELIIVDDGSEDNTKHVVSEFQKSENRIHYIYQENRGRSSARNLGIELSNGKYISFLDDDDYYLENFLMEFYLEIVKENFPIGVFMCKQIEETGIKKVFKDLDIGNEKQNIIKLFFKNSSVQIFMTSKKVFENNKFECRFEIGEDFHLFFRILIEFDLYFIDKYLCVNVYHKEILCQMN
ncbi:MAG: glycosyltransferase family 2 protein [Saprospiraceae bacterium]